MLDAEYKSRRILLLCTIRGAQRNINYEEVLRLTADADNTDRYALMLDDRMRDFSGSRRRVLRRHSPRRGYHPPRRH
jgi:hypothetical protein